MNNIFVEKCDDYVLRAGDICYALYKRYPSGFRYFIGYFRTKYDYDAEVEWLEKHEKEPEPVYYVAKEVSDWKLKDICDSAKYAEKLKALVKERWEAKQKAKKEYQEWKAELIAKGMAESDLPLSKRRFPPLLGEPTLADMYHYCMFDGNDMEPKWEAERKIAHELASGQEIPFGTGEYEISEMRNNVAILNQSDHEEHVWVEIREIVYIQRPPVSATSGFL